MDCLDTIVSLARSGRTSRIFYQKIGQKIPHPRVIEPYHLISHEEILMVRSWQVDPEVEGTHCWRNFRIDRIKDVSDGGVTYAPRTAVTICDGDVREFAASHKKSVRTDPVAIYRAHLLEAISDKALTELEVQRAQDLARKLPKKKIKLVHTQVFAEVLFDVLLDHDISDDEDDFLGSLRSFMDTVGWAP